MNLRKSLLTTSILAATLSLTACGGSSSNNNNPEPKKPVTNAAPTDIAISGSAVNDDVVGAEVGTLSATDDSSTGLSYSIKSGGEIFEIVDGKLKLKGGIALNYEQETDHQASVEIEVKDAGGLTFAKTFTITITDVDAVAGVNLYEFDSKLASGSSVTYTGQVARHALSADIKKYIGKLTASYVDENNLTAADVKAHLLAMWGDYEAVKDNALDFGSNVKQKTFAEISSSGKELKGKVAGNDAAKMKKQWLTEGTFKGWDNFGTQAKTPEGLFLHFVDLLVAQIEKHKSGEELKDPAGNIITKLYISADGYDLNQLIQKHTLGAVMFSQGTDDYLEQGLEADNTKPQKDGKAYTALEHQFDEGFGYFGAARNYLEYSDDEIASKGGRPEFKGKNDYSADGLIDLGSEFNWGNSTNAAKRDRGAQMRTDFTATAMNAFIQGRKIINENVPNALSTEQMTALKAQRDIAVANWEKAIAATVVHYINDLTADLTKLEDGQYTAAEFATLAKHFGEMKGFALNFQFSPFSPFMADAASEAKFAELHTLLGEKPALAQADIAAYKANLVKARDLLQEVYGFDAENVQNW